ncbi:MAG: hypothetical protein KDD75_15315 [Caldilineaceae bacterium]|nr:hypothetical protein [Caldilineaceae bacterium]
MIKLAPEDVREALRLIREIRLQQEIAHAVEHSLQLFEQQIATLYGVPAGYMIRDVTVGFEPGGLSDGG